MTAADPSSPWLSTAQAAQYLQASEATVMRAARRGKLRAYKLGARCWRFTREDLDAFLKPVEYTPKGGAR
jgi:excisionase family DNA binding protein